MSKKVASSSVSRGVISGGMGGVEASEAETPVFERGVSGPESLIASMASS